MTLKGAPELRNRLHAMERSTHGYPRDWADSYVQVARPQIPVKTGKTRRSVEVASSSDRGAEINGSSIAVMIDTGTKRHGIEPARGSILRFPRRGQTVFARKVDHPGQRAQPYRQRALFEALRRNPLAERVIDAWNRAA